VGNTQRLAGSGIKYSSEDVSISWNFELRIEVISHRTFAHQVINTVFMEGDA
jgi:hypothetical protein